MFQYSRAFNVHDVTQVGEQLQEELAVLQFNFNASYMLLRPECATSAWGLFPDFSKILKIPPRHTKTSCHWTLDEITFTIYYNVSGVFLPSKHIRMSWKYHHAIQSVSVLPPLTLSICRNPLFASNLRNIVVPLNTSLLSFNRKAEYDSHSTTALGFLDYMNNWSTHSRLVQKPLALTAQGEPVQKLSVKAFGNFNFHHLTLF